MQVRKDLSLVQNNIIALLTTRDKPLKISEMAGEFNCSYQTISNNLKLLVIKEIVVEAGKDKNAMRYMLGNPEDNLTSFAWRGKEQGLTAVLRHYAAGETDPPVGKLNLYAREIIFNLAQLLNLCADAIDPENPRPVTIANLKDIQARFSQRRASLKQIIETYDSLLNNLSLWDPREVVRELVIRDTDMPIETARSIHQNIAEQIK